MGPAPIFTNQLVVKVRPDQLVALDSFAAAIGQTRSEVVRWILDNGIDAIDNAWKKNHDVG